MASKKPRKSAFVPRLLVHTAIASAIPACALATLGQGCSSSSSSPQDSGFLGVAAVAYPAYESGVPDTKTDAPADAPSDGATDGEGGGTDTFFAVAYPAYETGVG